MNEEKTDKYEDILSTYLVRLSALQINEIDSAEAAMLLKIIGDYERISDHAVNILESAEELRSKDIEFSAEASAELDVLTSAVDEIMQLALTAYTDGNADSVSAIAPLEHVIDSLKDKMRTNHTLRLQQGNCTIDLGFIWSDLLTDLERISDHCSNIAGCLLDFASHDMNFHKNLRAVKNFGEDYRQTVEYYNTKYTI